MKQKEYCRPELVSVELVPESILCASTELGIVNESFGNNGQLDEVAW